MSRAFLNENDSNNPLPCSQKRNRRPSKFAEGIKELKRTVTKNLRKDKNMDYNEEELQQSKVQQPEDPNSLSCILPTGRKLKLQVVIKKPVKKVVKKTPPPPPKQLQKQQSKASLLDAFLIAFDKLKTAKAPISNNISMQSLKSNEEQSNGVENESNRKKQLKAKKQKEEEDKYMRLLEKYKILNQRLAKNQEDMIYI